jgi:hypothetical protein
MIEANDARERNHRRGKHIKLSVFTGLMVRASSMLMTIVSVPMALSYLGNERFGLWMTATSVVSMLAFADFGIGNGLLSAVAEASGRDDLEAIRKYISSGFAILIAIAVCMLLLFFSTAYRWWIGRMFSTFALRPPGRRRACNRRARALRGRSVSALIVPRVELALQHGFIYNLWVTIGLIASICHLAGIDQSWQRRAVDTRLVRHTAGFSGIQRTLLFHRNRQYRGRAGHSSTRRRIRRILNTGILVRVAQIGSP